ncbi:hypothetical protein MTO96_043933 [Rhipicephalus appendiculatus]
MTDTTYKLTGFGDFLERRRVTFLEPLPAVRVCSICRLVPPDTELLPCCHVVCAEPCGSLVVAAGSCPLDERLVTTASVTSFKFEQSEIEQLLVRCLNGVHNCSVICKLSELREHVLACLGDEVKCSECGEGVRRDAAAGHFRSCISTATSTNQSVRSTNVPEEVAKGVACMKRDLGKLRELVSTEVAVKDAVISGVNSLAEDALRLETQLIALAKENADLNGLSRASALAVVAPGPYRAASARGSAITLCKFDKVNASRGSVVKSELYTLLGYTFRLWCRLYTDPSPASYYFYLVFCSGSWDGFLEWPFSRRIMLVIPHLRDEGQDIRLEGFKNLCVYPYRTKPQVNEPNGSIRFESVTEEQIMMGGFLHDGDLYVNIEFV